MIALFLLIFAFQNAQATREVNLLQLVNSVQMNMNRMSSKMATFETKVQSLENEIKVRVDLKNFGQKWFCETKNHSYQAFEKSKWKLAIHYWNEGDWGIGFNQLAEVCKVAIHALSATLLKTKKADVSFILMEITKISDLAWKSF